MTQDMRTSRLLIAILILIGILAGFAVGALAMGHQSGLSYDVDAYQAVFLSNNQVYFGKLSKTDTAYPVLSDVYYIQAFAPQDLSNQASSSSSLQLVKLGSESHQPDDTMYLNRDQILFIEPLKPDSRIVQAIGNFKQTQLP